MTSDLSYLLFIGLLCCALSIMSCKSTKHAIKGLDEIKAISDDQLGKSCKCLPNADSTYYLCLADDDPQMDPFRKIYIVIDHKGEFMMDARRVHGEIAWEDNETLRETVYERILENPQKMSKPKTKLIKVGTTEK